MFCYAIHTNEKEPRAVKTVKIKVALDAESLRQIPGQRQELEWLWNKCRWVALHNHCLDWYKWAAKNGVSLDGCILAPLRFNRRNAWSGAACQIATGGPYWAKDETVTLAYRINKGGTWEERFKHGSKLVKGDRPYEAIAPVAHEYINLHGRELKRPENLDAKGWLSSVRAAEGLSEISCHSDFIGGLIKDFAASWDAYKDAKLTARHQPRFKDGRQNTVSTFSNAQTPPKLKNGIFEMCGMQVTPCDRSWQKRLGNFVPRSSKLAEKPSGWYLCISAATPSEALKPVLTSRRNKASAAAKKGIKGKAAQQAALDASADYQAAVSALDELKMQIEIDQYLASPASKLTGHRAGVDPGVKKIVALDNGALFNPNASRGRIAVHIESWQSRLDGMREANDRRLGLSWRMGKREATKNEAKLQRKIARLHERGANSSNMFNHKLATRLARTYDALYWENTQLGNLSKGVDPKLSADGSHWESNGAAAKTGLNYAMRHTCMGDLKAKTKQRLSGARKNWADIEPRNSSKECHACSEKGDRAKQDTFFCLNSKCGLHLVKQNADVNAAKNMKKRGD